MRLQRSMHDLFIVGDSMTRGYFGIPYTPLLTLPFATRGYDGATLSMAAENAAKVLRQKRGILLLLAGTNDLLASYYHGIDATGAHELVDDPVDDINTWIKKTQTMIEPLKDSFTLVLSTIPLIYRSSLPLFNELLNGYEEAIRLLSQSIGTHLIDLGSSLRAVQESTDSTYFPPSRASLARDAEFLHTVEHAEELLKQERGLTLSVDGVHPDSIASTLVAHEIDAFFGQTLHVSDTF
ncbi:MAG: SGNH/GDSL hydrolase family protein [Sphaerochaetaceae bacterium]|nr:SGNH/GDSL hydrolase family protein [Sphaerochaetaceae bacterium]